MKEQELSADEMIMLREAILAEVEKDIDATVVDIDKDPIHYEVNIDAKLVRDCEFDCYSFVIRCYGGYREEYDENGNSTNMYRFSKSELNGLCFYL